jgi:hypothetical protein
MSSYHHPFGPEVYGDSSRYAQDIETLFNSEKFSDVKIVCGHDTFFGHKNILASRNDVFAAMFDPTNKIANRTGIVQVDYLDTKTMTTQLAFIYCNKIDNQMDLQSGLCKLFLNNMYGSYPSNLFKRLQWQIDTPNAHAEDLKKLFNNEKFSDFKIICICGDETFFCHKNVLASRSDVFAAMFDMTNSTENQTGFVQVQDFYAKTMKTLLSFIYGNKINKSDIDKDLILAADKYNLPGLVKCCEDSMMEYMSGHNKHDTLEIFLSSREISEKIFNKAKEVIQVKGAIVADIESNEKLKKMKVEHPALAFELLEELLATNPNYLKNNAKMPISHLVWDNPKAHAQAVAKLFNSQKFSDIMIVCGSETFFCHKNILACKSDVFATMFNMTDSIENQKGVVQVDDFDAKTMKTVLAYIYGNNIDKNDGDMDLLLAADKYNLLGLVKCCEHSIISELSCNDALESLLSSRIISSKKIVDAAKLVIKRQGDDIKSNQNWNKLKVENPELAMEVLEYCITCNDDDDEEEEFAEDEEDLEEEEDDDDCDEYDEDGNEYDEDGNSTKKCTAF